MTPRRLDQARLRPHLRQKPAEPEPFVDDGTRTTDPLKLRGIGVHGKPASIARGLAGAGQLSELRQAQLGDMRQRAIRKGDRIDLAAIIAEQNNRCYLCDDELDPRTTHLEHIIPIVKGGTHTAENLAAACSPCNWKKGGRYVAFTVASRKPIFLVR